MPRWRLHTNTPGHTAVDDGTDASLVGQAHRLVPVRLLDRTTQDLQAGGRIQDLMATKRHVAAPTLCFAPGADIRCSCTGAGVALTTTLSTKSSNKSPYEYTTLGTTKQSSRPQAHCRWSAGYTVTGGSTPQPARMCTHDSICSTPPVLPSGRVTHAQPLSRLKTVGRRVQLLLLLGLFSFFELRSGLREEFLLLDLLLLLPVLRSRGVLRYCHGMKPLPHTEPAGSNNHEGKAPSAPGNSKAGCFPKKRRCAHRMRMRAARRPACRLTAPTSKRATHLPTPGPLAAALPRCTWRSRPTGARPLGSPRPAAPPCRAQARRTWGTSGRPAARASAGAMVRQQQKDSAMRSAHTGAAQKRLQGSRLL